MSRPPLGPALGRALRLRCPACGVGALRRAPWGVAPACPSCGIPTERAEPGYFLGALLLNLVTAETGLALVVLAVVAGTWPAVPWRAVLIGGGALAALLPVLLYPWAKLLWLAIDRYIQPELAEPRRDREAS